jgi:hypothetical protein
VAAGILACRRGRFRPPGSRAALRQCGLERWNTRIPPGWKPRLYGSQEWPPLPNLLRDL